MANHLTVYGMFRSRSLLEKTIEVLREEGFRSPDISVLIGKTTESPFLNTESGSFASSPRPSWISGTLALPLRGNSFTHSNEDLFTSNRVPQFVARGGLLLAVNTQDQECAEVATEVLEDAGVAHFIVKAEIPQLQSGGIVSSEITAYV
jgi:hypothetical protein